MIRKSLAFSSNGDNTVQAGAAGKRVRVFAFVLSFSGSVNAQFLDASGGTVLAGLFYGAATTVVYGQMPFLGPAGLQGAAIFQTTPGNALILNLSAGTPVGGYILYDIETT